MQIPAEDTRGRAFSGHLDIYYDEVTSSIRNAESILIMGPGEAKGEFKKHLEHKGLGERIVGVETVDKMTDPQIAAKVRTHFLQ
jgi:stalled ribosome rescue protein Dom34